MEMSKEMFVLVMDIMDMYKCTFLVTGYMLLILTLLGHNRTQRLCAGNLDLHNMVSPMYIQLLFHLVCV